MEKKERGRKKRREENRKVWLQWKGEIIVSWNTIMKQVEIEMLKSDLQTSATHVMLQWITLPYQRSITKIPSFLSLVTSYIDKMKTSVIWKLLLSSVHCDPQWSTRGYLVGSGDSSSFVVNEDLKCDPICICFDECSSEFFTSRSGR